MDACRARLHLEVDLGPHRLRQALDGRWVNHCERLVTKLGQLAEIFKLSRRADLRNS